MARKAIPVDKEQLAQAISTVEVDGPLRNRNELNEAVARTYNAQNPDNDPITKGIVYLRIRDWGMNVKTPKGRRGRRNLTETQKVKMQEGRRRAKTGGKVKNNPDKRRAVEAMQDITERRYWPLIEKVVNGSRAAAMKLQCLQCVGFKTASVRECTAISCPLWLSRPYQTGDEEIEV